MKTAKIPVKKRLETKEKSKRNTDEREVAEMR